MTPCSSSAAKSGSSGSLSTVPMRFSRFKFATMLRAIERRRDEPWFGEAAKAIEEEQAGEFASVAELISNLQRQIPLYFHRWVGNEKVGSILAEDFAHAEPLRHFNTVEFPSLDLRGDLRTIEAPTLVVAGDDDFIAGSHEVRDRAFHRARA